MMLIYVICKFVAAASFYDDLLLDYEKRDAPINAGMIKKANWEILKCTATTLVVKLLLTMY